MAERRRDLGGVADQQRAERLAVAVQDAGGRTGDADRGDRVARVVEDRGRHAADAGLVLLGVERVAAGPDAGEVLLERLDADERAGRQLLERLAAGVELGRRPRRAVGHDRLARAGGVGRGGGADRGEHPHAARALDLVDVDHAVVVEHDEVDRLTRLLGDALEMRASRGAQAGEPLLQAAGDLGHLVAEHVAAGARALCHVAALGQRREQPVDRARDEAGAVGELGDAELVAGGERLEQVECAIEGLDAVATRSGHEAGR